MGAERSLCRDWDDTRDDDSRPLRPWSKPAQGGWPAIPSKPRCHDNDHDDQAGKKYYNLNFFSTITNPNTLAGCLRTACAVTLLLLFTLPAVVQAQDYTYTTNADNTITITGYTGDGGDVVIPDTINSLPVISIGNAAFWFCTSLTSVTIPNSVTSIGADAFYYCFGMSNVMIGNSITSIGIVRSLTAPA